MWFEKNINIKKIKNEKKEFHSELDALLSIQKPQKSISSFMHSLLPCVNTHKNDLTLVEREKSNTLSFFRR